MTDSNDTTFSNRIRHALALIEVAIAEAGEQIRQQNGNPKIDRKFEGATAAFTISASVLKDTLRWDPFFHDWESQYRYAANLLEKRRFSALEKLLAGKTYSDGLEGTKSFAPEVIERISAITGDLRHAINRLGEGPAINQDLETKSPLSASKSPASVR